MRIPIELADRIRALAATNRRLLRTQTAILLERALDEAEAALKETTT